MNQLLSSSATVLSVFVSSIIADTTANNKPNVEVLTPKIQAAILLDVSNSMDGLIDQAKNQLWNMVNVYLK